MGNAATAKKGNEQESGEQSNTTGRARRVVLASVQHELAVTGRRGEKPFSSCSAGRYKARDRRAQ